MKGSFKVAKGEEVKGMLLSDLDTANGQKTMFSKGFNNVETAAWVKNDVLLWWILDFIDM